jgi:hypothetical protein
VIDFHNTLTVLGLGVLIVAVGLVVMFKASLLANGLRKTRTAFARPLWALAKLVSPNKVKK